MDISHSELSTSPHLLEEEEAGWVTLSLVYYFMGPRDRSMWTLSTGIVRVHQQPKNCVEQYGELNYNGKVFLSLSVA